MPAVISEKSQLPLTLRTMPARNRSAAIDLVGRSYTDVVAFEVQPGVVAVVADGDLSLEGGYEREPAVGRRYLPGGRCPAHA